MVLESNTLDVLFVKDGQQGEDGKVLYTWIKYAKAANGTGMTDDPDGAIYIGISYNNESSIASNDPTQYAWTKIQGADGKKGEDAYTIFLENENISFATDENRDPLSEQAYTSGITIMKGAKPVTDFTIGDIAKTQGIAVAKTDTAIAISVVNGNPLPSDSGEIVIPISVGGTVFKKILSWTCAKKGDQGIQGPQGVQGEKGKDGTSVTISNKSITYQLSASGTVVPTGTWQTSPQTIPEGQYQWTKTSVTYSDGNKTESFSISYHGKNGSDGTSVKTTSTSVKYQVGDSGTTKPTGTWQSNVPTVAQGKYLWTQTIVNYSDGNSTESYSVSYRGIDGSNGVNGMNAATVYLYQRATSTPSKPSNTLTYTFSTTTITGTLNNGWSTAIPTGTDAVYVTVASVSSKNDTATIATSAWSAPVVLAQNGKTGSDGKAGLNVATIYLYQRNTSKPSKPSASVTYTFSTGVASGLNNGWSQKIPDGTNPLYVTLATASSNTATDTILSSEWSNVVVMAQNGEDGQDGISPKVSLSKTGDTTTISIIDATGTHTQTVKDGTNGTPGAAGKDGKTSYFHVKYSNDGGKTFTGNSGEDTGIYMGSYTDYTEADSTDVKKYNWVKVKGDKGDTGQKGQDGTSIKITSKSVTYQTSTSGTTVPTGTWVTTVPTVNNGQYLWTKTTVQYSDGNKTEAYSVSYKGTNGTNGTSVTVSKTEVTYQVSTSGTTAPTGTWSTTMPSCDQGQYLWTKTYVKYSDGKETTSYSVSYKGVDGEKFAWNLIQNGKGNEKRGFFKNFSSVNITEGYGEITLTSKHNYIGIGLSGFVLTPRQYEVGKKVTWSYDIMYTKWDFPTGTNHQELWLGQRYTNAPSGETATGQWVGVTAHDLPVVGQNGCELNKWFHVEVTKTIPTPASSNVRYQAIINFYNSTDISATVTLRMKNVKLEYGDTATPWSPAQSDLEGRGVTETVQYYLATSQASGVTSSTSGWSTDITTQKLTADKKYLWNCYQTKYSDGTSEPISTPKVIGVYGDKGTSTKIIRTSYEYTQTNIDKFSTSGYSGVWGVSDATTGLKVGDSVLLRVKNITKGSDCLIFANITAIPSNYRLTCTSYGLIDNGADGQNGAGFHWNLLSGTKDFDKAKMSIASAASFDSQKYLGSTVIKAVSPTSGYIDPVAWNSTITPTPNTQYTISFYAKASVETLANSYFYPNCTIKCISNHQTTTAPDGAVSTMLSTEWERYSVTWTTSGSVSGTKSIIPVRLQHGISVDGATVYLCGVKLEQSDKPSPWCTTYEETLAKNLSITPSSQYFKSTDGGKTFAPNAITIKATIQGEINFGKWQYSIDGGVSFADIVSGQKGLTINNNVLTVSKDSSLYSDAVTMVTFRAVASDSSFYDTCSIAKIYDVSDIGDGRNLLWNSNFAKTDEAITGTTNSWGLHTRGTNLVASIDTSTKHNGFNTLKTVSAANGDKNSSNDLEWFAWGISERTSDNLHSKNQNYTLSFYAKASVTTDFIVRWGYDAYGADTTRTLTTNWQKYEIKLHQATSAYSITIIFKLLTAGTVWFSEFKLEKGSSATGYSTAPEDLQTAILSTKSEISDVSLKVDKNKQAIEQRVEKTTYEQDLNLVKGDISKANEGLNKWRYEIYPKSLFASEYQGKSTMDVFAKNTNLTPSQSVLINDTDLSIAWNYAENYIGYALTFAKFSAAKSVAITFAHDDGAHIYLNGKLIGGSDVYSQTGESLTLGFVKGWNCIEVVVNDKNSYEGFTLGTTISTISECQLMNCYYGTPVARQSHITNQLVENTTNIKGISTKVSKVTSVIGDNGENFTSFKNEYSDFKQTMNGFKTTVSQTYVTKDDFNGLEIGGRNLLLYSQTIRAHKDYYGVDWLTDEVETFNGCPVWSVKNQWGKLIWLFKSHVIDRGLVKVGDTLTYSLYAKTNNASGKSINCSYRFKGNANAYWFNGSAFNVGTNWTRYSVTFTITKDMLATDTYMTEIGFEETASMSGDDKVYYACPKLERGTKATDYTPALEDNEINGQNLVSNLSSNWEQGSVSYVANSTYASIKTVLATRLRTEDVFSVSGNVTISAGTSTNSSKEELNFYYVLFDVNKKAIGVPASGSEWQSLTSPKIINCGDAKYMAIILRWGSGSTVITPSNISQICLKIERGTSATPFTLAPEDVNGKIVNAETIANQTANKFSWIVKSGTSASNFEITDKFMNLVSTNINLDGIVSFMNTAKGDGRKNLYNLDYSSFENVASQKDAICYAKDNGVTSVSIDSSVSYDGNKSLKISYTTANLNSSTTPLYLGSSANNYGCVKIQAGKQYLLSCYVKSDSATGLFMIDIQGHDTPDTKTDGLYLSNIDPRKLPGSSTGVNLSTDWQRAVCAIKVANNATGLYWSVVPLIWGRPSSSSAPKTFNVWVDCIMLEEVDSISNEPGTYIFDKETIIDGGSIKTDTITGNQILAGSITADKIDVNSIFAQDITATGTITGANLIGATGTFSGQITATQGSIAGWTIIKDKMYTTGSGKYTGIGKYGSAYAFWAGATSNDNGNSAVFKVGHTGKLTATDADITGTITATNGKIGRYDITSTYLMTNSGSNASGIGGNQAFWAGAEDSNSAPFRVGYDGVLWAENAAIRGSIETGNLGDEGDTVSIINGHIGIQGTSNNVEIYSTGFKFGIDGDYYLMSVSEGVKCYRNLYATDFVADGWLYCSEVHSSGAVVIGADSESFYWAHGYQIARGTSWGGVCVGDDSQQLRLYGSSIWASHSISTSDENLKENFTTLDQYENFYMNLNPIGFNYIGDYDGKKTHFGFGAHKTEDVLESEGYDADKFAVVTHRPLVQEDIEKRFGKDVEVDIETEYGVSYTEFIALNTHMIQKTRRELTKVKQEKADLEVRLQAIEAKLGL